MGLRDWDERTWAWATVGIHPLDEDAHLRIGFIGSPSDLFRELIKDLLLQELHDDGIA